MKASTKSIVSVLAVSLSTVCAAPSPQAEQVTGKPLSYAQSYCIGMAQVTAGTMEMVRSGGRSWPEIQAKLVHDVRQAGRPLNQADFDQAVEFGLTGVRSGDDPNAVAVFMIKECMASGWYNR